jgi:FkbM family methyltransferase
MSLKRNLKTSLGNVIEIKTNTQTIINHFNESKSYADFIINQMNVENIYEKYLIGTNLVIFDIGANIGLFSLHCSDRASIIYSFEPTPHHFEILKELTIDYQNIKPINIAISDSDSYIPFYLSDDNTTMNSIVNKYNKQITVKGQSILSFILENNIDKVDFIKCDIEGSEMIAIKEDIIKPLYNIVDKWFLEIHHTNKSVMENRNIISNIFLNVGYLCQHIGNDTLYVYKE